MSRKNRTYPAKSRSSPPRPAWFANSAERIRSLQSIFENFLRFLMEKEISRPICERHTVFAREPYLYGPEPQIKAHLS